MNVRFPIEILQQFVNEVFVKIGVPAEDAKICTDVIIASDLRGIESHGVQRLKMYYDRIKNGIQSPITNITILQESETTARLDAGHGMGHVAAYKAMQIAINKARKYGTGVVSVGNSTHFGIAGYYPLMAIKENMIGLAVTNARPSVAPTFGTEPMMGTNPISIGIPTDEDIPFLFDAATSIIQRGKIELLARSNTPLQKGWVINEKGELAIDSTQILDDLKKDKAALLPIGGSGELFGGHKGYGLAVIVEILSAALSGGTFLKDLTIEKGYRLGHFFMAIDVEKIIPIGIFKKISGNIVRDLRNSRKIPNKTKIYTAGEKEHYIEKERRKEGIPISTSIFNDLMAIQKELNLIKYPFKEAN
jgi:L-2-hydroxycarboxylate dehydrogenase (NAD+)